MVELFISDVFLRLRLRHILQTSAPVQAVKKDLDKEFGWRPRLKRPAATFGHPLASVKPCTSDFLVKRKGEAKLQAQQTQALHQKERLPKLQRKAVLDQSHPQTIAQEPLDFVRDNALAVIHEQPTRANKQEPSSLAKPDYGKVPAYLTAAKLKMQQDNEAKLKEARVRAQQEQDAKMTIMPDADKIDLLKKLKRHWGALNAAYQKLPLQLDTPSKKRSKEFLESQLAQCEADIQLLEFRPKIVVLH